MRKLYKSLVVFSILLSIILMSIPAIAWHLPDVKKGLAMKTIGRVSITPTLELEIAEFDFSSYESWGWVGDWIGDWTICGGIGNDLILVSFNKILVPVIELELGTFIGWDTEPEYGGFETGLKIAAILW